MSSAPGLRSRARRSDKRGRTPVKPYARLEMITASSVVEMVRAAGYAVETPLAVGVSTSGEEITVAQGAGLGGATFDVESVAYAASLAKQITGACAALLERRGLLDPDAPIAEWMPELPPWRERVRVRHLIHHTAGMPDVWPRMQSAGESDWTSAGVIAALAHSATCQRTRRGLCLHERRLHRPSRGCRTHRWITVPCIRAQPDLRPAWYDEQCLLDRPGGGSADRCGRRRDDPCGTFRW